MRGKRTELKKTGGESRITPAHAGKTRSLCQDSWFWSDHPRACGENESSACPAYINHGSPPRMRGKPRPRSWCQRSSRITPAHAGKTQILSLCACSYTDHPRACGENTRLDSRPGLSPGSPPRMRGKPFRAEMAGLKARITPAHAGKTKPPTTAWQPRADYPRACGENHASASFSSDFSGSPPRMRGKHHVHDFDQADFRITPAHAGKTSRPSPPWRAPADHPRACGENFTRWTEAEDDTGSPPRMRGKPHRSRAESGGTRITPAHAGKTTRARDRHRKSSDHPRACGENGSLQRK